MENKKMPALAEVNQEKESSLEENEPISEVKLEENGYALLAKLSWSSRQYFGVDSPGNPR